MGPEASIERAICREAIEAGWLVRKLAFLGTRGATDRLFGRDGRAVFVEFKAPGELPSRQQAKRHRELRDVFGFEVYWCDSLSSARRVLDLERR